MRLTLSQSHFLMALVEWITAKCGRVFSVLIGWGVFKRVPSQNALISAALVAIAASLTVRPETMPVDALLSVAACFLDHNSKLSALILLSIFTNGM